MIMNSIFKRTISQSDQKKYESRVMERINKVIAQRAINVIYLTIVIEVFLISIYDIPNIVEFGWVEQYGIHYLILHSLILIFSIMGSIGSYKLLKNKSMWVFKHSQFNTFFSIICIVFLSSIAMITGLDQIKYGSTTVFVFFVLFTAMYTLLRPKNIIIVIGISYFVFLVGQVLYQNNNVIFVTNITNVTFVVILSSLIACLSYNSYFDSICTSIKLEKTTQQLELLSITDQLTKVYNRRKFDENLEREISRTKRSDIPFSLLMFDIDYFKQVNDSFGHQVGDQILKGLSQSILSETRSEDTFARFGGEEFILILYNSTIKQAQVKAEKIRTIIKKEKFSLEVNITISVGITQFSNSDTLYTIVNRVDKALYKAKESGRDQVSIL